MGTLSNGRKMELTELDLACCAMVKQLRLELGLSQELFARQVGCTRRTLMRWEQGRYVPVGRYLLRLKQLAELNANFVMDDPETGNKGILLEDRRRGQKGRTEKRKRPNWWKFGIPLVIWRKMTKRERRDPALHAGAIARILRLPEARWSGPTALSSGVGEELRSA